MFKTYEFIYAGIPSSMYGLTVCDFDGNGQTDTAFGNKGNIIEARIPGRVRPLHYGVDYHKEPLTFKLVFGTDRELDRWDVQQIAQWLTGYQQYQWLQIEQSDMEQVQYRCLITELTPISVGWIHHAFEATVVCDCPYAYSYPYEFETSFASGSELVVSNDGSAREACWPIMTVSLTSGDSFSITNVNDLDADGNPAVFSLSGIPSGSEVYIDGANGIIQDKTTGKNLYGGFNDCFLRLVPGDNHLLFTGNGSISISYQTFYNVGA